MALTASAAILKAIKSDQAKTFSTFVAVGLLLLGIDTSIFTLLSTTSLETYSLNLISKGSTSVVGYFLHHRLTFKSENQWDNRKQIGRYISLLIGMLALSTLLITSVSFLLDSFRQTSIGTISGKLFVEGICVVVSYSLSKLWVYK